ncbi:MAG: hypothetical protein AABX17_03525 [Nanoarchaeota archaeon]
MIGWILLILVAAALIVVFKMNIGEMKHKIYLFFVLLFFVVFIFTFMKVVNANSVDLTSASGIFSSVKLYFSWLGHAFSNVQVLTGNVVRMNWFGNMTG